MSFAIEVADPNAAPYELSSDWQVAYVYAFLVKFSPIAEEWSWPSTAVQFEEALQEESAPPAGHLEEGLGEDWKPSMQPILTWFHLLLHPSSTARSRLEWLRKFVEERRPEHTAFWDHAFYTPTGNILSGNKEFWTLDLKDRVVLLRVLVDHCLAYNTTIRDVITEHYNLQTQRVARRAAFENVLVIEPLGRDKNKATYWHLDDSARIYKGGNPYRVTSAWETVSSVEAELANLGEDIKNSPPKASKSGSPGKVSPQKKLGNAEENSLVRKIKKQVADKMSECEERLAGLNAERLEVQKELEKKKEKERIKALPKEVPVHIPRETLGRRAAAKRVDYKAIEDGANAYVTAGHRDTDDRRASKRARRSTTNDENFEMDSPEPTTRRSARTATAPAVGSRSSRRLRGNEEAEVDPVAEVAAYEEAEQANIEAAAGARGLKVRPYVPTLPAGAKKQDYDLTVEDDYLVMSNGREKMIKGSRTAQAEIAAQDQDSGDPSTNVSDEDIKVEVPSYADNTSVEADGAEQSEANSVGSAFSEAGDVEMEV